MTSAPGKPGLTVSPLAVPFPAMGTVAGVEIAVGRAGFYKHQRDDLVLFRFAPGTTAAGVFTRHAVGSAPVDWCRKTLAETQGVNARALVVNAGCANSFTGAAGAAAVQRTMAAVAQDFGCAEAQVLMASTGVIGVLLDDRKILDALPRVTAQLTAEGWSDAARGIMTTDTFPKGAVRATQIDGVAVRLAGVCKGSGMIAPDMATMLAFVATDATIAAGALDTLLREAVASTMNAVTVDGDRSTNDTCLLFATGQSGAAAIVAADDPRLDGFREALHSLLLDLAQQLVRDGEGASKFVRVEVSGAASETSARRIARTICESPLVKTAIAGEDANWGRIVMAVGRADEPVDRERLSVRFGDLLGRPRRAVSPDYDEAAMSAYMRRAELEIAVDAGVGEATAVMWTCDLTHGYISINGDYRS